MAPYLLFSVPGMPPQVAGTLAELQQLLSYLLSNDPELLSVPLSHVLVVAQRLVARQSGYLRPVLPAACSL